MDFLREIKKVQRNSRGRKAILYEFDLKNIKTILELVSKYLFVD